MQANTCNSVACPPSSHTVLLISSIARMLLFDRVSYRCLALASVWAVHPDLSKRGYIANSWAIDCGWLISSAEVLLTSVLSCCASRLMSLVKMVASWLARETAT